MYIQAKDEPIESLFLSSLLLPLYFVNLPSIHAGVVDEEIFRKVARLKEKKSQPEIVDNESIYYPLWDLNFLDLYPVRLLSKIDEEIAFLYSDCSFTVKNFHDRATIVCTADVLVCHNEIFAH